VQSLTLGPLTLLRLTACRGVRANPMLLSIFPASLVDSAVRPIKDSISFLFIIDVIAFISPAVKPSKGTLAFHFVVIPLAIIFSTIGPIVLASSLDVVFYEKSIIGAAVGPNEFSCSVLFSLDVLTLVFSTIRPRL